MLCLHFIRSQIIVIKSLVLENVSDFAFFLQVSSMFISKSNSYTIYGFKVSFSVKKNRFLYVVSLDARCLKRL